MCDTVVDVVEAAVAVWYAVYMPNHSLSPEHVWNHPQHNYHKDLILTILLLSDDDAALKLVVAVVMVSLYWQWLWHWY